MKDKVLVVGSSGLLGNYLYKEAQKRAYSVEGSFFKNSVYEGRHNLDIRDQASTRTFLEKIKPNIILFPAFNPNVDYCEEHPEETYKVNVEPLPPILNFCRENNVRFVYYSTDYVFDGENGPYDERAHTSPLSVYGRQKLDVEEMIQKELKHFIIARITWVYGWEHLGKNFVVRLLNSLKEGKNLNIPSDQYSNPTHALTIAKTSFDLLENNAEGLFHVADKTRLSRFDFAKKIANFYKQDGSSILAAKTSELNQAAKRPLECGFILDKVESAISKKLPTLEDSLACFDDLKNDF